MNIRKTMLIFSIFFSGIVQSIAQDPINNLPTTVTWVFDLGTDGQVATYSDNTADYFKTENVALGSNLKYVGPKTSTGVTFSKINPLTTTGVSEENGVTFNIWPKTGLTFTPTSVTLDAQRFGTDGGMLDFAWVSADGTVTSLATGIKPERDRDGIITQPVFDLVALGVPTSTGAACGFKVYIYDLGDTKQVGLANITIQGTLSGTVQNVTSYSVTTAVSPEAGGSVSTSPAGNEFDAGTEVVFTAERNFGYEFAQWEDASGAVVSTENPYTNAIAANLDLKAVFTPINTYSLDLTINGGAKDYMVSFAPEGTLVDGKRMYETGTLVTMTAATNPLLTFTHWDSGETTTTLDVTMDASKPVVANYSLVDYIVGWDFYNRGASGRVADFASTANNETAALILTNAAGETVSWLDKSIVAANGYEGQAAAVNWKPLTGNYYYQISFSASNFSNMSVSADMLFNYNAYSTQNCEYSVDGETFKPLGQYNLTEQQAWLNGTFAIPADANNAAKVYVRWIADLTSDVVGTASANDGTAISAIYVTGSEEIVNDGTAPVLVSSVPAASATTASPSGKIVLTFDENVKLSDTSSATLGTTALVGSVSGKTVTFSYTGLEYNTAYTFTLAGNSIADISDNTLTSAINVAFTTLDKPTVTKRMYDFVVGKDGDFKAALAAAAASTTGQRFYIFLPNGQYDLGTLTGDATQQTFIGTPNVSFIGQSMEDVVLFNTPTSANEGIATTPTINFLKTAKNIYMQDVTVLNKMEYRTGTFGSRAVALRDQGDKNIYKNVKLLSNQDTYYTGAGRYYLENAEIHGTVDFIFGGGDAFFNECLIYLEDRSNNVITAASTASDWGYVFNSCTIDGFSSNKGGYRLGRPWNDQPKVVYLNTIMNIVPTATAWGDPMNVVPFRFAEYNSMTATGGTVDLGQRRTAYTKDATSVTLNPVLTAEEAATYTLENVLGGSDDWQPRLATDQAKAPHISIADGVITWPNSDYVLGWVIFKDGQYKDMVTTNTYDAKGEFGNYTVRAANAMGGLGVVSNKVINEEVLPAAFPGAEGFGRFTTGGRGGKVLHVTNLNDAGPGSFRAAVQDANYPRIVVFDVSGVIALKSVLKIKYGNVTVAGQSAPGQGICLKNYSFNVDASNVIIRYIRCRMGDESAYEGDAMWGRELKNIIIDHCSLGWSTDETASFYDNEMFTLQWCVLAESLRESVHDKGTHGYGGIWGGRKASFHHNLIAHHDSRNPRMCGSRYSNLPDLELVDFRNNVIYNWGANSGYAGEGGSYNFTNNYYRSGPATASNRNSQIFAPNVDDGSNNQPKGTYGHFYVNGNVMHNTPSVTEDNWTGIKLGTGMTIANSKSEVEFAYGKITTHPAAVAFEKVLEFAGASLSRDAIDSRIAEEAKNGTTTYSGSHTASPKLGLIDTQSDVGSWPVYASTTAPLDTDQDGMPDAWEDAKELNKNDASDNVLYSLSQNYTNVEVYLNSLTILNTREQLDGGEANYEYTTDLTDDVTIIDPPLPTSIDDATGLSAVATIYPNPVVSNTLFVKMKSNEAKANIQLISICGKVMSNTQLNANETQLDVSALPSGTYLVRIVTNNQAFTGKIVKQ